MAQLLVRNIDEQVVRRLKDRARTMIDHCRVGPESSLRKQSAWDSKRPGRWFAHGRRDCPGVTFPIRCRGSVRIESDEKRRYRCQSGSQVVLAGERLEGGDPLRRNIRLLGSRL